MYNGELTGFIGAFLKAYEKIVYKSDHICQST